MGESTVTWEIEPLPHGVLRIAFAGEAGTSDRSGTAPVPTGSSLCSRTWKRLRIKF